MRAREIHAAAAELVGESIRWSSVKGILSAHTIGGDRRFRRIRRGCYELTPRISGRIESLNPTRLGGLIHAYYPGGRIKTRPE